jgi:glutaconate CoA-transferase subunit A
MTQTSKLVTMQEAVASVPNGAHMTFSGFAHSLAPLAFTREMIRQGKREIELTSMGEAWVVDLLCAAGALKRSRLSNYMFEGWGRCRNFSRSVESGEVEVEDYSHFGITSRLMAGALGLPYLPVRSMNGTDIMRIQTLAEPKALVQPCPFTGELLTLVPKSQPDIAVIHASRADAYGNVQVFGHASVIDEQVRAAKRTIVTVEEVVATEVIRQQPERTLLPSFLVDMVVEAPYGAHPAGMYRYYDYDRLHIDEYMDRCRTAEGARDYLNQYVLGMKDHWEYLEQIGIRRLMALRADPACGYSLQMRGEG